MRSIWLVSVLSFVLCQSAVAETGRVWGRVDCSEFAGYCSIKGLSLKGPIDDSMTQQLTSLFDDFFRRADEKKQPWGFTHTQIKLNSAGGSVTAAMAIGRLLKKYRMTAWVAPEAVCNSACVLIYAGAVARVRNIKTGGVIGIHQPFFEVPGQPINADVVKTNYTSMLRDLRSYLHEMNVSEQLADEMLKTPANDMRYLSNDEQNQFGLVIYDPVETEILDLEKAQELGLNRLEFNRRQALVVKTCPTDANYGSCYEEVMRTGKQPALDLREFEPVE
jgi:ATP-dependent protease ClpP protease subunit